MLDYSSAHTLCSTFAEKDTQQKQVHATANSAHGFFACEWIIENGLRVLSIRHGHGCQGGGISVSSELRRLLEKGQKTSNYSLGHLQCCQEVFVLPAVNLEVAVIYIEWWCISICIKKLFSSTSR